MLLQIQKLLKKIIKENYHLDIKEILLEKPPKKNLGDFTFACFVLSKDLKKNPNMISEELMNIINTDSTGEVSNIIESSSNAGPYLNIKINKQNYTSVFNELYTNLKKPFSLPEEKIIIFDYIGANVGKPLHIGHMCTPNIGQALINGYKKLGYTVIGDSHIGDWGIIFGKLIAAYKEFGGNKEDLEEDAVDYLLELYIKITLESETDTRLEDKFRAEFKLLSQGDTESVELWKNFTSFSIESMEKQLKRLNIQPDYHIGESFYEGIGLPKLGKYPDLEFTMKDIVSELIRKGIATKNDDNSVGVVFDGNEKIPSCILQKRDGTHGYLASDLACIKYRVGNWKLDKIIYCVDVRQQLHFKQAFVIARKAGWLNETELIHAHNGFISLRDGAMSTRKGKIIKLDVLLDEAEKRAEKIILEKRSDIEGEELKNLSKIIGIGAIKYGYLKKSRETDVIFDFDEFISFEGNSGPYIQYAYVRARKILEKSNVKNISVLELDFNDVVFENDEEVQLVKALGEYKIILEETVDKNMPHILCAYSYSLTKSFSSFYNNVHILNEEDESKKILRLKLMDAFCYVVKDSFEVLGIEMPEKM